MPEYVESWGVRCKRLLVERRTTGERFAELCGVAQSTMNKWLNGKREPKIVDFERMAAELSKLAPANPISAPHLVWGDPSPEESAAADLARALKPHHCRTWMLVGQSLLNDGAPDQTDDEPPATPPSPALPKRHRVTES